MATPRTVVMGDGLTIPQIGFGTYKMPDPDAEAAVATAIEVGYRHIDTATMYGNEIGVGRGLAVSGVPREDLFVVSKLNNPDHEPTAARAALERTLTDLALDRLDLYLVHWPYPEGVTTPLVDTWNVLVEAQKEGLITSIGMSNGEPEHLREIRDSGLPMPAVNQIEIHPYLHNSDLVRFTRSLGITVESWSPIARGQLITDPVVVAMSEETGIPVGQIILAWHLAKDLVVIPKASSRARIAENFGAQDVTLSAENIAALDGLYKGEAGRTGKHPSTMKRFGE